MLIDIAARLQNIRNQIALAEKNCHRASGAVKLLAVSKGQPLTAIQVAVTAGQFCFGENYIQEALPKIQTLQASNLEWHFLGAIQSNKTKSIAENFSWVHSICREKIAERLNAQRNLHLPPLNVCIEINVSDDPHKSGIAVEQLLSLAKTIQQLPQLKLRGLMTVPAINHNQEQQQKDFRALAHAFRYLRTEGYDVDTLSMGMSDDFAIAICEGSTLVRIGTAIFGHRTPKAIGYPE